MRYKYELLHFDFRDKMIHVMNEKDEKGWEPVGGPFVYGNQVCWAIRREFKWRSTNE